jgi:cation diffusion facilitator CzcD-associated flavoprotein CzcO
LNRTANRPAVIPTTLPAKTPKDEIKNGYSNRFSYTPMHNDLESNINARVMSYSQEPFPADIPVTALSIQRWGGSSPFRHRETIRKWVQSLVERRGYDKLVEYNTTVELAEKVDQEWILTLRRSRPEEKEDFWWQETFDAVVVANGHYTTPFIPETPGLAELEDNFPGTVKHSKSYRGAENYAGKVSA